MPRRARAAQQTGREEIKGNANEFHYSGEGVPVCDCGNAREKKENSGEKKGGLYSILNFLKEKQIPRHIAANFLKKTVQRP